MTEYTKGLLTKFAAERSATHQVEHVEAVTPNLIRVVASFNRVPVAAEIATLVGKMFGDKARPVDKSFRMDTSGMRPVVAGFITGVEQTRDASETAKMQEIASGNVFLDKEDNSIWNLNEGNLVRAFSEDLAELASVVPVRKIVNGKRETAAPTVPDYVGPDNTQMVAYVNSETASLVVGFRVGEDHVFSETAGLQEIGEDQVVETRMLKGTDLVPSLVEAASIEDPNSMADYYQNLYGYDPAFFDQISTDIKNRAIA